MRLKKGGKPFKCPACREADFVAFLERDVMRWTCDACTHVVDGVFEALPPPRNDWQTPQELWLELHREYHFNLDAAASQANTKCPAFFDGSTPETDALLVPWTVDGAPARVWCNPPYQPRGTIEMWLEKALREAAHEVFSVLLIPMASSVAWFNDMVVPFAEWHTFRGRIPFVDPLLSGDAARTSPKQDNLLVILDPKSHRLGHRAVRHNTTGARLWNLDD